MLRCAGTQLRLCRPSLASSSSAACQAVLTPIATRRRCPVSGPPSARGPGQRLQHNTSRTPRRVFQNTYTPRRGSDHPPRSNASQSHEWNTQWQLAKDVLDPVVATGKGIESVIANYDSWRNKGFDKLGSLVTLALQRCLTYEQGVTTQRDHPHREYAVVKTAMDAFAGRLADDIMTSTVQANDRVNASLLIYFKRAEQLEAAKRFWKWLELQDAASTGYAVYGAAIELLAADGVPLPQLEELYETALARVSNLSHAFASYHFSPLAVLSDRSQALNFRGLPMRLLASIMNARLMHGDVRKAYLALDTAMRLYPEMVDARFFDLFIRTRPPLEAFAAFALACRSGLSPQPDHRDQILEMLRNTSGASSASGHVALMRGLLSTCYLQHPSEARYQPKVLNALIDFTSRFMRIDNMHLQPAEIKQRVADAVLAIIRNLIELFARYGVAPTSPVFDVIIADIGGIGGKEGAVDSILDDMRALGLTPSASTGRAMVTAAGISGNGPLLVRGWQTLVHHKTEAGTAPDSRDLSVLIRHATRAGQLEYARQQFEGLKEYLDQGTHAYLEGLFAADTRKKPVSVAYHRYLDVDRLLSNLSLVQADIKAFSTLAADAAEAPDAKGLPLPMTLLAPEAPKLPESEMRRLYDDMTTADHAAPPSGPKSKDPSISRGPVSMPYDTLRYENWKTINYLLEQSNIETQEGDKGLGRPDAGFSQPDLDKASRQRSPRNVLRGDVSRSYGISDAHRPVSDEKQADEADWTPEDIAHARHEILLLRGRHDLLKTGP